MNLYLIRHPKTNAPEGTCYGHYDWDLDEGWDKDIEKMISKISPVDAVYSSPLIRCKILSELITVKDAIYYDDRLKELNFGTWEGKAWNAIDPKELNTWMEDFVARQCPGGESYEELFLRVSEFWQYIKSSSHQSIAIVTHAGVIRSIVSLILGIPLKKSFNFKIDYTSISKVEITASEMICYLNYL